MSANIHAIVLIKNEEDILPLVLQQAVDTCDRIHMYDTGSTDQSLVLADSLAAEYDAIQIIHRTPVLFDEFRTRKHALSLMRNELEDGDWVIWLDADEFIGLEPEEFRVFLKESNCDWIRHRHYNFGITRQQLERQGEAFFEGEFLPENYTFYKTYAYTEFKMMKWRSTMFDGLYGGRNLMLPGKISSKRLPILHYPFRSISQMEKRLKIRNSVKRQTAESWNRHWSENDLLTFIYDEGDSKVLRFDPNEIQISMEKYDGLRDARWSTSQYVMGWIKYELKRFIFILLGPRIADLISASRNSMNTTQSYMPKVTDGML